MRFLITISCLFIVGLTSAQSLDQSFLEAIRTEKFKKAGDLLKDGANINALDNKKRDALEITLSRTPSDKRNKFAKTLLNKGININTPTNGAIYQSIVHNDFKIFKALLAKGAKPDAHRTWDPIRKRFRNETPLLIEAIKYSRAPMVNLLLKYDADPNEYKQGSLLPLTQAILDGDIQITQALIDHGADVTKTDSTTGYSAYGHAISSDNIEVFDLLLTQYNLHPFDANTLDNNGRNGLNILALNPNEGFYDKEITEGLIKVGINIDHQRKNGNTPIHDAVLRGKYKMAKVLLYAGADTMIMNKDSVTVTQSVLRSNDHRILNLFNIPKEHKAWKNTYLKDAVIYKQYAKIDSLIALGAQVNGQMLAIAVIENDIHMLKQLLETGVSPHSIDKHIYKYASSKPIMEYAFKNRLVEVITTLLTYGYDVQKIIPLEHRYALQITEDFHRKNENQFTKKKEIIESLSEEEQQLYNSIYCTVTPDKFRCAVEIKFNCKTFACSDKLFNHTDFELRDSTGKTIYKSKFNKKDIRYLGNNAYYKFDINYFSEIPQIRDRGIHLINYVLSTNFSEKGIRYKIDNIQSGQFHVFNLLLIDQKFEVANLQAQEKPENLQLNFDAYYKFYENEIQSPDYYYEVTLKTKNGGIIYSGEKTKIKLDRKFSWTNARVPPEKLNLQYKIPYGANYISLGETEIIAEINFYARSWGLVKEYNVLDSYNFPFIINQKDNSSGSQKSFKKDDITFDIFTFEAKEVDEYREYGRKGILLNVEYVVRSDKGKTVPKIEFYPVIKDNTGKSVYIPTYINEKNTGVEVYETLVTDKINFALNRLNILELFIPLHKINTASGKNNLTIALNADVIDKYVTYHDIYSTEVDIDMPERYLYSVNIDSLTLKRTIISDANRSSVNKQPDPYWVLFADKQTVKRVDSKQDAFDTYTGKTNFLGLDTTNLSLIIYDEDLFWSDILTTYPLINQESEFKLDTALDTEKLDILKYGIRKHVSPEYSFRVVPNQKENGVSGIKIYTAYKYHTDYYPIEIHPLFSGRSNSHSLGFITDEKVGSNNRFYSYAYIGDTTYVGFYMKLPNHDDFFDKTDKQKIIAPENINDVVYELESISSAQLGDVYGAYFNFKYNLPEYYLDSKYDIKHHLVLTSIDGDSIIHQSVTPVRKAKNRDRMFLPYYKLNKTEGGIENLKLSIKTKTHRNVTIGNTAFNTEVEVPPLDTFNFYIKTIKLKKRDDEYLKQSYSWNIFINNELAFTSKLVNADEKNQLHWPEDFKKLYLNKNDIITIRLDYKSWDNTYPVTYWKVPIRKLKRKRGWYKLPSSKYTKRSYIKFEL